MQLPKRIILLENNFISTVSMRKALTNALAKSGYEVYVLSHGMIDFEKQLQSIEATSIEVGMSKTNPLQIIQFVKNLSKTIKKIQPDIILTFTPRPTVYGNWLGKQLGIPTLATITGTIVPFHTEGIVNKAIRLAYKQVLKHPKFVFFQNKDDKDLLLQNKYVSDKQIVLVPGSGVDTNYYKPIDEPNKDTTAPIIFLFVGRLLKNKGVIEFLESAKQITHTNKNVRFWIVGPYYNQNTVENTITPQLMESYLSDQIIYKGESDQIKELLQQADVFVLPSYREGLSNALLEAASMQKPIITTNVTGCKEVVDHSETGLLCEAQSTASLQQAMEQMLAFSPQKRYEMGVAGRRKVIQTFEKSIVINTYLQKIKEILNQA